MMIRLVGGRVFLLVPAHPGSPRQRAVKRLLLFWQPCFTVRSSLFLFKKLRTICDCIFKTSITFRHTSDQIRQLQTTFCPWNWVHVIHICVVCLFCWLSLVFSVFWCWKAGTKGVVSIASAVNEDGIITMGQFSQMTPHCSEFLHCFGSCWLGDKERIQPGENLHQSSPTVLFGDHS